MTIVRWYLFNKMDIYKIHFLWNYIPLVQSNFMVLLCLMDWFSKKKNLSVLSTRYFSTAVLRFTFFYTKIRKLIFIVSGFFFFCKQLMYLIYSSKNIIKQLVYISFTQDFILWFKMQFPHANFDLLRIYI